MRIILLIIVLLLSFPLPGDTASISFVVTWSVVDYAVLNIVETGTQIASIDGNFAVIPVLNITHSCSTECFITEDLDKKTLLKTITLNIE